MQVMGRALGPRAKIANSDNAADEGQEMGKSNHQSDARGMEKPSPDHVLTLSVEVAEVSIIEAKSAVGRKLLGSSSSTAQQLQAIGRLSAVVVRVSMCGVQPSYTIAVSKSFNPSYMLRASTALVQS